MQTHCKRGHEFTPENIYVDPRGHRACIACRNINHRKYRASSKAKKVEAKQHKVWTRRNKEHLCLWHVLRKERVKREVLTQYGKGGKLLCCWKGCKICDIDMLSLDHINNDGKRHRQKSGRRLLGIAMYMWIKRNNYPKGFQTLCCNHQFKKEIIKRRKERTVQP